MFQKWNVAADLFLKAMIKPPFTSKITPIRNNIQNNV